MPVLKSTPPTILHAIVGTAGHVDHGKTSLVRLLTGCDTDRLPEEKARGMSIDLGFAPCLLHGRRLCGIVDVPGHKDFIRNMVAGATSIDVLLLVIAADDSVMPQTDEHMKIINLLRAPLVMVALTKIDMVEPEMLELARQDVAAFLTRCGFPGAPICPVSNKTGDGISDVRDTIDAMVERVQQRQLDPRAFRMNIERVFSVKGYGTVVTGIPVSGQVRIGEKVELLPAGKELTIRTIQSYKQDSELAFANCCSAINVREIDPALLAGGMTIALPGVYRATGQLIVCVRNVSDHQTFARRFEARLHTGTAVVDASIKLLEAQELPPGQEACAHVVLSEPLAVAASDRFILRAASPPETIGGGVVLSAQAQRFRRHASVAGRLAGACAAAKAGDGLRAELLAGPDAILASADVIRFTQYPPAQAASRIQQAVAAGQLAPLGVPLGVQALACSAPQEEDKLKLELPTEDKLKLELRTELRTRAWGAVARVGEPVEVLTKALSRYHRDNPYTWGMTPIHACELLGLPARSFDGLARFVCRDGTLAVKRGRLALASFKPNVSERLMHLREQILAQIQQAGVNGPARGNLMKDLAVVEKDMQVLTRLLTEDGTVMMLDGNFVLRGVYEECRAKLLGLFQAAPVVDMSAFRDAIASNRKLAVAMLDAFDAEGLTRRVPDGRVLVKHVAKSAAKEPAT